MLEELLEFYNNPEEIPETKKISKIETKIKPKPKTSSLKKDLRRISISKQVSIMDKIQQRKEKEEAKKVKLLKFVNKKKKINLRKFLNRMRNCQQKRKYDLELQKYEQLKKDTSSFRDKPKINKIQLKLFENLPKEPLYRRTEEVLDERKKRIENLSLYFILPKEIQKQKEVMRNRYKKKYYSAENTKNDLDDYEKIIMTSPIKGNNLRNKKKKKKGKIKKQKSDEFYNKQEIWLQKAKKKYLERLNKKQNDNQNYTLSDVTFHPYINKVSLDILEMRNRVNSNNDNIYKYNITNNKSQDLNSNKGRTIYDKLYQDSFKKYNNIQYYFKSVNYYDAYNENYNYNIYQIKKRNRFKSFSTKFLNAEKNKKISKKFASFQQRNLNDLDIFKRNKLKMNKTLDEINKSRKIKNISKPSRNFKYLNQNISNYDGSYRDINKRKKENDEYKLRKKLMNLKTFNNNSIDQTYHLNVRENGAWEMDSINYIIDKRANTRYVVNSIIN